MAHLDIHPWAPLYSPLLPLKGFAVLELIVDIFIYLGAAIALIAILGLWALGLFVLNEEANTLFKHRRNDRFANKLFKKIEEIRNDFA